MGLNWNEIKSRALLFSKTWADACNEDSQAKPFWIDFFEIFGITNKRVATFELNVKKLGGAQGFVDLFWPGVLLVEHKSRGKNLDDALDQAVGYLHHLPERDLPQLVVVCDFARFRLHRLATGETVEFELKHLHKHVKLFGLLAGYKVQDIQAEDPVNIKAAERMGRLHDALKASGYSGHALEVLLVRLLFCLFADDTGIFQPAQSFRDFVEERTAPDGSDLGPRLGQLFQVLNTHESQRSKAIDEQLGQFAYINGRLFEETLPMADFNTAMREALLDACALDWSAISPAIFGSLFQSIMDDKARRNLGAHYTSEANILKLIKPLFLDELHAEFERVKGHRNKLFEFHKKLRQLTFFDPACGCGNFLVISYRELRELELKVLRADHELSAHKGQLAVDVHGLIGVNVDQFYGIEIEEFPAQIAQVALWLVDHQMNLRVSVEFGLYFARIPLKSSPQIRHANALRLDWHEVLPAERCSYVLGNPPFLGKTYQSKEQKADLAAVMQGIHGAGDLDFVCGWYVLAAQYMQGRTGIQAAFVSTNSITQGEQVAVLWGEMQRLGMHTHFAHRTFQWSNEASGKAAVHCVIVGIGPEDQTSKTIYEYEDIKGMPHAVPVKHINAYLVDAPDVLLSKRRTPICKVPEMAYGSKPTDGGHLLMDDAEKNALVAAEPQAAKWVRPFLGAEEFINSKPRWCLWLVDCPPKDLRLMPDVLKRVQAVKEMRQSSTKLATISLSETPALFGEIRQPTDGNYLLIPLHSSEMRSYVPIGFCDATTVCGNANAMIPDATLFHFGILTSAMHNAFMRFTCGRLESRFRYSNTIVYNNYPWPGFAGEPLSDKHRTAIEQAAQCVLDARAQFASSSLADLYDPLTMPPALLKAHQKLDTAVDAAYQPSGGKKSYASDAERVAFLFELYQRITSLLPVPVTKRTQKTKTTEVYSV
ncbi:DNA methyltransferase [Limnohabitans radicicola]|uniref:site-specific DNA-methyltransferase (adenine-specific) n=1 Tax=Limnohabitans radicicola TaxID=2771427 RepID=A0A927IMB7_9BURK|nr:DNA methyltransferase [Limnohabitans radicicola]MBD8051608.1 class I SAM-dependent DNA methyltransferase [Limnohabitans radicicola]